MILAIDPGGTTGLAYKDEEEKYHTWVRTSPEEVWDQLGARSVYHLVILEQFNPWHAHIDKYGLHTLSIIGGVRALCWEHHIKLVEQPPQFRIKCVKQARQHLEAKHAKFMIHEVDALAHLFAWEEEKRGKVA